MQSEPRTHWWINLAWRLGVYLPPAADGVIDRCARYLAPFAGLRVPVAMLRGPSRIAGRPGSVIGAGAGSGVDYMVRRFFEGQPRREQIGTVPIWHLARTLKRLRTSADMTIARVDRITARFLFDSSYLAVPEWIGTSLTLPEDLGTLTRGNHSLKEDLRIVRRSGLTSDIAHTDADFEAFYHTMYVPYIRMRHGQQAAVRNIHSMRRLFRHGGLVWIRRKGRPVAGCVYRRRNQELELIGAGTINGEWAPVAAGAFAMLYLIAIQHAKTIGCRQVEVGGCRPTLNDGALRYKRKWGVHLIEQRGSHYDFMVHWHRCSQPVIDFLAHTPIIFRDHDGLSAVTAIGPGESMAQIDAWRAHRSMRIPGLRKLHLVSTSGSQAIRASPPGTVLVDLPGPGDPQTLQLGGIKR